MTDAVWSDRCTARTPEAIMVRMPEVVSALLIPVPAVDSLVGRWRSQLDPAAADGVPAHMTLNYPWVAPQAITSSDLDRVTGLAASVDPFAVTFASTGWFGEGVLWLKPEPPHPVEALILAVLNGWTECPLYGNPTWTKDDIVAHVTVGYGEAETLREAERDVLKGLPVEATINEVWLMQGVPGEQWEVRERFTLGAGLVG